MPVAVDKIAMLKGWKLGQGDIKTPLTVPLYS